MDAKTIVIVLLAVALIASAFRALAQSAMIRSLKAEIAKMDGDGDGHIGGRRGRGF